MYDIIIYYVYADFVSISRPPSEFLVKLARLVFTGYYNTGGARVETFLEIPFLLSSFVMPSFHDVSNFQKYHHCAYQIISIVF